MGHLKVVIAVVVALTLALLLYPPARAPLSKLLRALLWAACAMSASTGAIILGDAHGSPIAIAGGFLLLGFSAYAAATAIGRK